MAEPLDIPVLKVTDEDIPDSGRDQASNPNEQSSQLLADALKRMDGLIGDYRPPSDIIEISMVHDPVVVAIVDHCNQVSELMKSWDETKQDGVRGHPKDCVPKEIRENIISWLSNKRQGSSQEVEQLREDKSELLKQVVSLQQQLENLNNDRDKLSAKVADLERKAIEKDEHLRTVIEDLRITKTTLQTKEVEIKQLHSEIKVGLQTPSTSNDKHKRVTIQAPPLEVQHMTRKGSFRRALAKTFGRKKAKTATLDQPQEAAPLKPVNPRASAFYSMNCDQVAEWLSSVGLDMYSDLAKQNLLTGDILAGMVSRSGNVEFVRIGIARTLHCKKIRLAVEDAVNENPSPVGGLDHTWLGAWLCDIGLPQYQRSFMDARFDGRMLNIVTLDDLNLVDVVTPFHVTSIKRGIQALRMCGYDKNYLQDSCLQKKHGSQKLLHWSVHDVVKWVKGIELEEYIGGLSGAGIHGALMLLDVQFTSDSLARALGISPSKTLIRTHLSRKFMELIGPVAAQNKVDAMQTKSFIPLDPTEQPKGGGRQRSRSVGSRKGKNSLTPEVLLCPFEEFPESMKLTTPTGMLSPTSTASSRSSGVSPFPDRPPTP